MRVHRCEALVIGAGVVGMSVADALQSAGRDVFCLERASPGAGQSGGYTRVFRHLHADSALTHLAVDAREEWRRWGERAGGPLVGDEGVLVLGSTDEDEASLTSASVNWRRVNSVESRRALPLLASDVAPGLFDVEGGAIRVEATLAALAGWLGARLILSELLGVEILSDSAVRVETSRGLWECERLIVCAGSETQSIASALGCALPVANSVHLRATFSVSDQQPSVRHACLLDRSRVFGPRIYASPIGDRRYAVGLSGTEGAVDLRGEAYANSDTLAAALAKVEQYVRGALPELGAVAETRLCRVTEIPTSSDSFALWRVGPVSFLAGHNLFKFAPVLGRMVADAVYGLRTSELLVPPGAHREQ